MGQCKDLNGYREKTADHCGDDWYAQDWNFGGGNDDLGKVLLSSVSGQVIAALEWDGYGKQVVVQLEAPLDSFAVCA